MLNPQRVNGRTAAAISLFLFFSASGCAYSQTRNKAVDNQATQFDSSRAFEHVKKLVALGPHPSGSDAIKKAQQYLEGELTSYGLKVTQDNFTAETPRGTLAMKNV